MKGNSKVTEQIVILRWTLNGVARIMALKKERVATCGLEVWEQWLADAVNALIDAVNDALEKEDRTGLKLTGRIELTEWENTEEEKDEIPQPVLGD